MKKHLRRSLIGAVIFMVTVLAGYYVLHIRTKSYSPEDTTVYQQDDLELEVFYNRPYKKDRKIFGGLVPYNEVWRTGANEATTFQTNKDIMIDGSVLTAGKYTLWTIPGEESWKVIFNSEMYPWGITLDQVPSRLPEHDVLTVEVQATTLDKPIEQFVIDFDEANGFVVMVLAWDTTAVYVPVKEMEMSETTAIPLNL